MFCATAAPTRHPPGEAHSLPAPAPLVTTLASGPLPVNRASEVPSRRLAAHPIRTRRPLSPSLSLSATPQLQPAQPLSTRVAKNASGDTRRHATARPPLTSPSPSTHAAVDRTNNVHVCQKPLADMGRHGGVGRHGTLGFPAAAAPRPARPSWPKDALGRHGRHGRLAKTSRFSSAGTTRRLRRVAVSASCRPAHHSELSSPSLASKLSSIALRQPFTTEPTETTEKIAKEISFDFPLCSLCAPWLMREPSRFQARKRRRQARSGP